jgi:rhodanese-related sulfurtransferase
MNIKIISIFIITFALIINLNFSYEKLYISINIRNISLIDLKEALNLINNNNAILIDSRNNNSYNKEHIPGALNLPFNNFEGHFKILNNKDRNVNIIIYNDELECSSGLNLAIRLIQKKFNNIFVIKESYEEWKRKI